MKEGPVAVALAPQPLNKGPLVFNMEDKSGGRPSRRGSSPYQKKTPPPQTPPPVPPPPPPPSVCAPAAAPPKEDVEPGKYAFQLLNEHCYRGRQGNRLYRCDVCGGVYRHAFSLKRHYLRSHVNYIYLSHSDISNCGIHMPASGIAALVKQTEASGNDQAMPGLFRCHLCGALFHCVDELKSHVAQHPVTSSSISPSLVKVAAQAQAQTPSDRRVSCPQCRATFSQRQYLTRHLASAHSGEKPFLCRHCGKGFPTVTNQRRHERIHEGLKPYACSHCPAGFTQSGDLKKHIRSMHSDKFHPCTLCRKYFSAAVALAEHSVACHGVGKNETPHASAALSCGVCAKKLASFPALCRHYRMSHPKVRRSMTSSRTAVGMQQKEEQAVTVLGRPLVGEAYFYANVSRNISDNLQHHIDGKIAATVHPEATPTPPPEESDFAEDTQVLSWSHYNFPMGFSMTGARCTTNLQSGFTDSTSETMEDDDDYEEDALDLSGSSGVPQTPESEPEEADRLKMVDSVFVCYVCGERFHSTDSIEVHKINNHPNVFCTHLELEGVPQHVPHELFRHRCSPEGALGRICHVLLPAVESSESSSTQLNCTKCGGTCDSVPELHEHILACGVDPDRVRTTRRTPLISDRRVIRRGMKRRLEGNEERYARYTRRNGAIVLTSTPTTTKAWSATCSVPVTPKRSKRLCSRVESEPMMTRSADSGGGRRATDCRSCGQVFHHRSGLLRHQRFCQQRTESSPSEDIRKQHGCPHCGRHFTYMASLRKHVSGICPQRPVPEAVTPDAGSPPEREKVKVRGNSPKKSSSPVIEPEEPEEEPEEVQSPIPVSTEAIAVTEEEEEEDQGDGDSGSEDFLELKPMAVEGHGNFIVERPVEEVIAQQNVRNVEENTIRKEIKEDVEDDEEEEEEEEEEEVAFTEVEDAEGGITAEQDHQDEENKAEDPKKDIQHSCPNCRRSFTYLANFKKHVKELCPLKERLKMKGLMGGKVDVQEPNKKVPEEERGRDGTVTEGPRGPTQPSAACRVKTQTFPCTICHRVFSSYVLMLKHRLSHKLKTSCNLVNRDDSVPGEGGLRSKRLAGRGNRSVVIRGQHLAVADKGVVVSRGPLKVQAAAQPPAKEPPPPSVVMESSDGNNQESAKGNVVMDKAHISVFRNAIRSKVKGLAGPESPMPVVAEEAKAN